MVLKWNLNKIPLSVICTRSEDNCNHFALMVKKQPV